MSLNKLVLSASYWTFFGHVSSNIIRLISNLILTRLLFPELFGLMAVVYVVIAIVAMLTDMGVRPYVIQNKEDCSQEMINTAWTLQIIRGLIVWCVIGFFSFFLYYLQSINAIENSSLYNDSRLPILIFVASFSVVISGLNSISIFIMDRNFGVKLLQIIHLTCRVISVFFMVTYSMYWPNVWGLVLGALLNSFLFMVASHYYLPGSNHKLFLDKIIARKILSFGKWIMLSTMMTMLIMRGDIFILTGFVDAHQLGLYSIAILFVEGIKGVFSSLSTRVWFPLLSEVKRKNEMDVSRVYYKIRFYQDFISYFFVGLLFVLAPLLINLLYDDRYREAGEILSILSFSVIGIGLETINLVLISAGDSKAASFVTSVRAISLLGLLYVSIKFFGFSIALWAIALNYLFALPVAMFFLKKHGLLRWYKELWTIPFLGLGYLCGIGIEYFIHYNFGDIL